MTKQNFTALFLSTLLSASSFAAQSFNYRTQVSGGAQSCAQEANDLRDRFTKATGLAVKTARCDGELKVVAEGNAYTLDNLSLQYEANLNVLIYQAVLGHGILPGATETTSESGIFGTYQDCLNALDAQKTLFEAQTKLPALSAHCEAARSDLEASYVLFVEGAGKPAARLESFVPNYLGDIDAAFAQSVRDIIAHAEVAFESADHEVLYYSKDRLSTQHDVFGFFADKADCTKQLSAAQNILLAFSAKNMVLGCHDLPAEQSLPTSYVMEAVRDGGMLLSSDFGHNSPKYASVDDCLKDLPRFLDLRRESEQNVAGGICSSQSLTGVTAEIYSRF